MKRSLLLLTTALVLTGCNEKYAGIAWLDSLKAFITGEVPQKYLIDALPEEAQKLFDEDYIEKSQTGSYLSGRFAQSNFDWETADKYFSEVLADNPADVEIQKRAMVLAMGAGHYQDAFDDARKTLKVAGPTSLPQLFLALESMKAGNYSQVISDVQKMPDDGVSEFVKPLMLAWSSAGNNKLDISLLNKNVVHYYHAILIADYLKDDAAMKVLAQRDYSHLGLSAKSIHQIADIFTRHGLDAQAKLLISTIPPGDRGELALPVEKIEDPVQGMARALFDMATLLYQEYPDSARLFAQMSLYLNPNENDSRILMAHMSAQFKRYDEAIAMFNEIDPGNDAVMAIRIQRQIAELLDQAGKTTQAIEVLNKVVEKTGNIDAQIQIGDIYRQEEDFSKALDAYDKAFGMLDNKITVQRWNLLYSRGIVNERLKKWQEAEKDLKSALVLQPDQPYVLNYLGYSWIDQGIHMEEATNMIEKAARLHPEDGYIIDSLGWAYYKQGKYEQAAQALERAIELSPYDATINSHLGDAYWQVGRKNEARFEWQRALNLKPDAGLASELELKIEQGMVRNETKPVGTPTSEASHLNKFYSHD